MSDLLNASLIKEFYWAMRYIDQAAISKSSQKRARLAMAKMEKIVTYKDVIRSMTEVTL